MDREEFKKYVRHREPMLLVDKAEKLGDIVVAEYKVTGEEPFLQGHFPDNPIVPGVILCEMMAQPSILLSYESLKGRLPLFAGMNNVRFKKTVHPGDTVVTKCRITAQKENYVVIEAKATVDGKVCCSATQSFILVEEKQA
ncbi:MAG: 3-hydroxyacyl-ACP dehydratase FabZ [Bacteroidales bacterium]|nr:3-hydroxyacyl-ACP dehydratase FabZ [Bacteroidales bacterium]